MEELSVGFIEAVANSQGYFSMVGRDYGTDMHIRKALSRPRIGKSGCRYLTCQQQLDVQVKSTCERGVDYRENFITYPLKVDNYNDLVVRANDAPLLIPLILILFIFPDNETDWLYLDHSELKVRKHAYWYTVPPGAVQSANDSTQTIHVPKANLVDSNFFNSIFNTYWT
ncbi:MAG: DUF4365 domain-containing protein [Janthinobacterium lividum]